MKAVIHTAVWGDSYLELFVQITSASLLSENNLPKAANSFELVWLVHAPAALLETYKATPQFRLLEGLAEIQPVSFEELGVDFETWVDDPLGKKYSFLSHLQNDAMRRAIEAECDTIVFNYADIAWADGAISNALKRMEGGELDALFSFGFPLDYRTGPKAVTAFSTDDGVLTVKPRELVNLALDHMHPDSAYKFWGRAPYTNNPSYIAWRLEDDAGILVRCAHMSVTALRVDEHDPIYRTGITNGTLDESLSERIASERAYHVMQDSDEFYLVTFQSDYADPKDLTAHFSPFHTVCHFLSRTPDSQLKLFDYPMHMRAVGGRADLWAKARRASAALLEEARTYTAKGLDTSGTRRDPLRIVVTTAFWGEGYLECFTEYSTASLLSRGNLPLVSQHYSVVWQIIAPQELVRRYMETPEAKRVAEYAQIGPISFEDLGVDPEQWVVNPAHDKYSFLSMLQNVAMGTASRSDIIIFNYADCIWADGSLYRAAREMEGDQVDAIMGFGLPVDDAAGKAALTSYRQEGRLEVSARDGVALALDNLSPMTQAKFWGDPNFSNTPSFIAWPVGDEGILVRCAHLTLIALRVSPGDPVYEEGILSGSLDGEFSAIVASTRPYRVIQTSDDFFFFSLYKYDADPAAARASDSPKLAVSRFMRTCPTAQVKLYDYAIQYRRTREDRTLWKSVITESAQLIDDARADALSDRNVQGAPEILHPGVAQSAGKESGSGPISSVRRILRLIIYATLHLLVAASKSGLYRVIRATPVVGPTIRFVFGGLYRILQGGISASRLRTTAWRDERGAPSAIERWLLGLVKKLSLLTRR